MLKTNLLSISKGILTSVTLPFLGPSGLSELQNSNRYKIKEKDESKSTHKSYRIEIIPIQTDGFSALLDEAFDTLYEYLSRSRYLAVMDGESITEKLNIRDVFQEENDKVIVVAEDEFTKNWLFNLKYEAIGVPAVYLKVDDMELKSCNIKIRKRRMEYSEKEFKDQLEAGNPGLTIEKLKLFEKRTMVNNENYWIVTFGIDENALEEITKREGRVRFDMGYTNVNVLELKEGQIKGENVRVKAFLIALVIYILICFLLITYINARRQGVSRLVWLRWFFFRIGELTFLSFKFKCLTVMYYLKDLIYRSLLFFQKHRHPSQNDC